MFIFFKLLLFIYRFIEQRLGTYMHIAVNQPQLGKRLFIYLQSLHNKVTLKN